MRKAMVACASSGASAGDGRSATGTSTSTVPTSYGPVYSGKALMGLQPENQDAILLCPTIRLLIILVFVLMENILSVWLC